MENLSGTSGPGGDARSHARALFQARSALHLGKSYSSVGDIPNFSSTYHTSASASTGNNTLTRILTWNVGGADGTLADPVKLNFLCNTMLIQGIHIALIAECHADVASVKRTLRELHLHTKFRVRGQGKLIAWLVQKDTADRIVQDLSLTCGRVSGIVLAGACQTRTLIIGIYGISGATTDHHCSRAQQELLASLTPTITANLKLKHHIIVLGDFNVTPGHSWSTSASLLSSSMANLESWRSSLGLTNALLERNSTARLTSGLFTRSRLTSNVAELSLLDHAYTSPDIIRGAAILIMPAGAVGRTTRFSDHDALVIDVELGFAPNAGAPKRPPIVWASHYSPQEWKQHHEDDSIQSRTQEMIETLQRAESVPDSVDLDTIFSDFVKIATPECLRRPSNVKAASPEPGPIEHALGRFAGRIQRAIEHVRHNLPRNLESRAKHITTTKLHSLLYLSDDVWADTLKETADLRTSLSFSSCQSGHDWCHWLQSAAKAKKRLHQIAKHQRRLWSSQQQEYTIARATQEARAGRLQSAIRLIFRPDSQTVVDNGFWRETSHTEANGTLSSHWEWVIEADEVAREALRLVSKMFPPAMSWAPESPGATFPADYAAAGLPVVSSELATILQRMTPIDLAHALDPMSLDDYEDLLRQQKSDSSPGCTGLAFGHLRAMGTRHRRVCLLLINRFLRHQECPSSWLDVGIALIPKSNSSTGLGAGRPISLLEALLKLSEAWVWRRIKPALTWHRSASDPLPPAPPKGFHHDGQFFDSGFGRGCHDALITVFSVLHGLKLQGRRFCHASTDISAAFPRTPTTVMEQRYDSLGMNESTVTQRLKTFLQIIDQRSSIRVRTRSGYSDKAPKGTIGIHQGAVGSPPKYGLSVEPLLEYLDQVAAQHNIGIDLSSIAFNGHTLPLTGSFSISTDRGEVTFFTQGGRLVAIMFADDLFLIAEAPHHLQLLLDATQEFYTSISASLNAFKSVWSGSHAATPWSIDLIPPTATEEELESLATACRHWKNHHPLAPANPRFYRPDVHVVAAQRKVRITGDLHYLQHLGDPTHWLNRLITPAAQPGTLLAALSKQWTSISVQVHHRPLHVVNPKTGAREYLSYVKPDQPIKYLGIKLRGDLSWDDEFNALKESLLPLLQQARQGRQLGLPWDVYLQCCSCVIMGLVNYHTAVVPFTTQQLAWLNNKICDALKPVEAASPHHLRCSAPLGLSIPDVELAAAQLRLNLAMRVLHSDRLEGQTLRWCLRVAQDSRKLPSFLWSDLHLHRPLQTSSFIDAVAQSLQQTGLRIRTDLSLFPSTSARQLNWPDFMEAHTPPWASDLVAKHMPSHASESRLAQIFLRPVFNDVREYIRATPRDKLSDWSRTELWTEFTTPFDSSKLPPGVSISDGTGDTAIGCCQLDDTSNVATIGRLHAGDSSGESELLGLLFSDRALKARTDNILDLKRISDCQSAQRIWQRCRDSQFCPTHRTHGRNTVLELYIACHHPWRGDRDATDIWAKGHSDSLDPSRISPDEQPIFDAHVTCDKLATRCSEIPAATNIVAFTTDYCFLLCNATGSRLFTPLATHIATLRRSLDYHARQTRKVRQHSTGSSWRGLSALSLDLPDTRTPWDGPRAYPPEKRHLLDCTEISDLLRAIPEFPRGAIMGRSKTVTPLRINLLAGLAPLTAGPTVKGKSTLAECPFCDAGVLDTLHHCLYDCTMNRHTGDVAWCAEAVKITRNRFRSNALTAMLELGCPFDTSAPTRLPRAPPPDTSRAEKTTPIRLASLKEVQSQLRRNALPVLGENISRQWFNAKNASIRAKQLLLQHRKGTPDANSPSTKLLQKALDQQQTSLADNREMWRRDTGDECDYESACPHLSLTAELESRSRPARTRSTVSVMSRLNQLEQCLFTWTPPWLGPRQHMYAMTEHIWQGVPPFRPQLMDTPQQDWPAPPSDGWLFAGLVTDPFLARQLGSYATKFSVPLLFILGTGLPTRTIDIFGPMLDWPMLAELDPDTKASPNLPRSSPRRNPKPGHCHGRFVLLNYPPANPDISAITPASLPPWITHWPMLYRDYSSPDDFAALGVTRRNLIETLAEDLCNRADKPWWWLRTPGVAGQAELAGVWSETLGAALRKNMPPAQAEQLYASHFWDCGCFLASIFKCRSWVATSLCTSKPSHISTVTLQALQQHATRLKPAKQTPALRHGWTGAPHHQVNLGTTQHEPTDAPTPAIPRRRKHDLAPVTRLRDLLTKLGSEFYATQLNKDDGRVPKPWENIAHSMRCTNPKCTPDYQRGRELSLGDGWVLPSGHMVCPDCNDEWAKFIVQKTQMSSLTSCLKDDEDRCCYSCGLRDTTHRTSLRKLLIRSHLSCIVDYILPDLALSSRGHIVNILTSEVADLHRGMDQTVMISIPGKVYSDILSLLCLCIPASKHQMSQFVPTEFPLDRWANNCRRKLCLVDTRRTKTTVIRQPELNRDQESVFKKYPALYDLATRLTDHSGYNASLLFSAKDCPVLRDILFPEPPTLPEPADWSLRHTSEAVCCVCNDFSADAFHDGDLTNLRDLYQCAACNQWWHLECMTDVNRELLTGEIFSDEHLADQPPDRCQKCINTRQHAVNRILEVVRTEDGKFVLLYDYLGYEYWEIDVPTARKDGHGELLAAYKDHEAKRTSGSLCLCVSVMLEMICRDKTLADHHLDFNLAHVNSKVYLISHRALRQRGFSQAAANVYQLLVNEHRLFIPFDIEHLLVDLEGKRLPPLTYAVTGDVITVPPLHRTANHLTLLTREDDTRSLPMAITQALHAERSWKGMGLVSGSKLSDVISTMQEFGRVYARDKWPSILRAAMPDLTDTDIDWLSSLAQAMEHLEPPAPSATQGPAAPAKRKRYCPRKPPPAQPRRSPRFNLPSNSDPIATYQPAPTSAPPGHDLDPPPSAAASQYRALRPQLSRAFRTLYGTAIRPGIVQSMHLFAVYCHVLGQTYYHSPDPIVFFGHEGMMDSDKWPKLSDFPDIDWRQRQLKLTPAREHPNTRDITDPAAGVGSAPGVPP